MNLILNNNSITLRLGSRKSELAKVQTKEVIKAILNLGFNKPHVKYINSIGDQISLKNFKKFGGKGLFTKDIDTLTIKETIDIGIHSLKDIPGIMDETLTIGAVLPRVDPREALITKNMLVSKISDLPSNSIFASSSPRRLAYIKHLRPDLKFTNLRGNINTRIKKIHSGKPFSTLLAMAGLIRLGNKNNIKFPISIGEILPPAGQGVIALVHKKNNLLAKKVCGLINDIDTNTIISAERSFIKKIQGDCNTPLSAYAEIKNNILTLKTRLFSYDGSNYHEEELSGNKEDAEHIGEECALKIIKNGGLKLL